MGNNIYFNNTQKTMKFFALATILAVASAVTIRGDKDDHSGEFFEARDNGTGPLDKKYERVLPVQFADASDDLFMRSMIMNYAREGKNVDGSPNGLFTMTEAQTRGASAEVLGTHKKMSAAKLRNTLTPISQEPGLISMSTRPVPSELKFSHNSSDSSLPTNNSPSNEHERDGLLIHLQTSNDRKFLGVSSNNCQYLR